MNRRTLLAAALAFPAVARAQAPSTLRIAVSAPPANLDPQYYTLTPSNMVAAHMFEALIRRDAAGRLHPGLAQSWTLPGPTTWEFTLRDATFHDGSTLHAEDVAYTLARIPTLTSPGSFAVYLKGIQRLEVVDAKTLRIHTAAPYPLLLADLAQLFILPRSLGTPASSDFNTGQAAIGTGPFRFAGYKPGDALSLTRNRAYWGTPPIWDQVAYRIVSNPASRVAALLSGDVDLIDNVPTTDAARLRRDAQVRIAECPSFRLIYIGLDTFRPTPLPDLAGPNNEPLTKNPLQDPRVREALSLAINRPAIVERTMEGAAIAAGQFMPRGAFAHAPDLVPPPFDPARARALLREAGYPDGFRITLHGPTDRYVNDAQILQVVAQQWTRIGVRTEVDALPMASLTARLARNDASAYLLGWSNPSGDPSPSLRSILGTPDPTRQTGLANYGRYSNPELDRLTAQALQTLDDTGREALMQDAMRQAMRETAIIPLHIQENVWATRASLAYAARTDEMTLAVGAKPA